MDGTGRFEEATGYYDFSLKFFVSEEYPLAGTWEGFGEGYVVY